MGARKVVNGKGSATPCLLGAASNMGRWAALLGFGRQGLCAGQALTKSVCGPVMFLHGEQGRN